MSTRNGGAADHLRDHSYRYTRPLRADRRLQEVSKDGHCVSDQVAGRHCQDSRSWCLFARDFPCKAWQPLLFDEGSSSWAGPVDGMKWPAKKLNEYSVSLLLLLDFTLLTGTALTSAIGLSKVVVPVEP